MQGAEANFIEPQPFFGVPTLEILYNGLGTGP